MHFVLLAAFLTAPSLHASRPVALSRVPHCAGLVAQKVGSRYGTLNPTDVYWFTQKIGRTYHLKFDGWEGQPLLDRHQRHTHTGRLRYKGDGFEALMGSGGYHDVTYITDHMTLVLRPISEDFMWFDQVTDVPQSEDRVLSPAQDWFMPGKFNHFVHYESMGQGILAITALWRLKNGQTIRAGAEYSRGVKGLEFYQGSTLTLRIEELPKTEEFLKAWRRDAERPRSHATPSDIAVRYCDNSAAFDIGWQRPPPP